MAKLEEKKSDQQMLDKLYFFKQYGPECVRGSFNNCMRGDVMSSDDLEEIKKEQGEDAYNEAFKKFAATKGVDVEFHKADKLVEEDKLAHKLVEASKDRNIICFLFTIKRGTDSHSPHRVALTHTKHYGWWYMDSNYDPKDFDKKKKIGF
eukprot:467891_1